MTGLIRRIARGVREVLLTTAALGGIACIILVILAFTGGYSLVLFKTGSMAPTIPPGSLALVQRVDADTLRVGDVVTVERPGKLPITHRIREIEQPGSGPTRLLTLRGDANQADDPLPYEVTEARIVRGSVPRVAPLVAMMGDPWVLGGLTLGAAALVTWAFWPRSVARRDAEETADGVDAPSDEGGPDASGGPGSRRRRAGVALAVACAVAVGPAIDQLRPASAAAASSYVQLRSDLEGRGVQGLDPVVPRFWHVDVDASRAPRGGTLDVVVEATGDEDFGLRAEVRACRRPWQPDGSCGSRERILRPWAPLAVDGEPLPLSSSATPDTVYIRIALTAAPAENAAPSTGAAITLLATAFDETVETDVGGRPDLAPTGGRSLALLAAPAALLIGLGAVFLRRSTRKDHRS